MWAQGTPFSHVSLEFEFEKPLILESVAPVSRHILKSDWEKIYEQKDRILIAQITEGEAKVFIACMVDIPYSVGQLAYMAVQSFVRKVLKIGLKFHMKNGVLHCSEMYAVFVGIFRQVNFNDDTSLIDLVTAYDSMKNLRLLG
jgi:hypothetical protein